MFNRKLIDYLPLFLNGIIEYDVFLKNVAQVEIEEIWSSLNDVLNNQFVSTATEARVKRWEKLLNITPKSDYNLDDRKFTIMTRLNEKLPFTMPLLKESLAVLCGKNGYELNLDNNNYTLKVSVELTAKNNFEDVKSLFKRIIPANMIVDLKLKYNQYYKLEDYEHLQLEEYSHENIRSEVLNNGN